MTQKFETILKVRYVETDAMGFVHHSAYATYFEVARIEALEKIGAPYEELEKSNVMIPVLSVNIEFLKPARFGDTLTVQSRAVPLGLAKIEFNYEVFKQNELICQGSTAHAFMNNQGRAIRPPRSLSKLFV